MCSNSKPHGPALSVSNPAPPRYAANSSRLLRSSLCCTKLPGFYGYGFGALDGFFLRQFGGFVGLGGMAASRHGMFHAGVMGAFVALFRGGAMALGGSLMVIGGGYV
jgi:hypothetical protein